MFTLEDLSVYLPTNSRWSEFISWFIIIVVVPVAWCIWNWLRDGDLFSFLHKHIELSGPTYEGWGSPPPSMKSAVFWLVETTLYYDPILAALAVTSIAGLLTVGKRKEVILIWFVLLVFMGGLILLFARGGFPTAAPDRYLLVPSLLMVALSAHALSRLIANPDHYVRIFAMLLLSVTLTVNFALTRRPPLPHDRIREAAMVADLLRKERGQGAGKVLFERDGYATVVQVFLNNPQMIIEDRAIGTHPEQNPLLMQPKEVIRRFAQENGIDRIAIWSDRVHAHVNEFGLRLLGRAGSYAVYSLD